jgi:hypothetical protein
MTKKLEISVLQILVAAYLFLSVCVIAINIGLTFSDGFKENFIRHSFALGRDTQDVKAEIIGYDSFERGGGSRARGGGTPRNVTVDYALVYQIKGKQYLGSHRAIHAIDMDVSYSMLRKTCHGLVRILPKSIIIQVDKDKNHLFSYNKPIYGLLSLYPNIFILFWALGVIGFFFALFFRRFWSELSEFRGPQSIKEYLGLFAIGALCLYAPYLYTVRIIQSLETKAENVTGFQVLAHHYKPCCFLPCAKDSDNPRIADAASADISDLDKGKIILRGLADKNINDIRISSDKNPPASISFEHKGRYTHIQIAGDKKSMKNLKYSNIYAFSSDKKYILPLRFLQHDFDYR